MLSTMNCFFINVFSYDIASLILNRFIFFQWFLFLITRTCVGFLWLWLRNPLICGSVMNHGLFFIILISYEVFCICFFVFVMGKPIRYQYSFDIHIIYIDCFFRRMKIFLLNFITSVFQELLYHLYILYHIRDVHDRVEDFKVLRWNIKAPLESPGIREF